MIDDDVLANSMRRRWLLPLGVAGAVTATGVAAVLAFGGGATMKPAGAGFDPAAGGTPTTTPTRQPVPAGLAKLYPGARILAAGPECLDLTGGGKVPQVDPGYRWSGVAGDARDTYCLEVPESTGQPTPVAVDPTDPVVTAAPLRPLPADQVETILKSCLGTGSSKFHAVIAVNTAITTHKQDGVVVAADSGGAAIVCTALHGETGHETPAPRGGAAAAITEFVDSGTDFDTAPTLGGQPVAYLLTNVGRCSSDVTKVTVSYGDQTSQYPAIVKDGYFYLSVSTPWNAQYSHPPVGYVHAFDASGKEIYNGKAAAPQK